MKKKSLSVATGYAPLLREIKDRIRHSQTRALMAVNGELVRLYWDIGRLIDARQRSEGWGASVIPRLARELKNDLPEEKGFSERNIGRMIAFFRIHSDPTAFLPQVVAKLETGRALLTSTAKSARSVKRLISGSGANSPILPQPAAKFDDSILWAIPWYHHVILMENFKDDETRLWYMRQTLANGWSRSVLVSMIQSEAHSRQGRSLSNFDRLLPPPQSDLIHQTLKDPYIFDFLTLQEPFHERELETNLLKDLEQFLLELGQGFAFVGRQMHVPVGHSDFYIDLLFYHLRLRCFVVIELKKGEFRPEHAGKMNFYLSVVDDRFRHPDDAPSIGMILCQDRNTIVAEYALRGVAKPIGVSEYELTRALPKSIRSSLPTVEQIEAELSGGSSEHSSPAPPTRKVRKRKVVRSPRKRRK